MYLERELGLGDLRAYVRDLFDSHEYKQSWIGSMDALIDKDVHIADYLIATFFCSLGILRYATEIITSLPNRSNRLSRKYETYILLKTLKIDRAEPSVKVTHPLKGIDFALDSAVEALKSGDTKKLCAAFWKGQIDEMEDQKQDREKDRKTGQPNIFDPRIENNVRSKLREWDAFYSTAAKELNLESLESQWDNWKKGT